MLAWQERLKLPSNILLQVFSIWQMAAEGQSDRIASDIEVWMKQRCDTEFFHAEKMAPINIHRCLLNFYGDQTVDVSTGRCWVLVWWKQIVEQKTRTQISLYIKRNLGKSWQKKTSIKHNKIQAGGRQMKTTGSHTSYVVLLMEQLGFTCLFILS